MTPVSIEQYRAVIAGAPGPAPWYLGQPASDLSTPDGKLTWKRDPNAGPTELIDSTRRTYALASIYTYVRRISTTQFVVWYKSGTPQAGQMHFQLYEISSLQPMAQQQACTGRLKQLPFIASTRPISQHSIPRNQAAGSGSTSFPSEFAHCPELFILVSNDNTWDNVELNLWIIQPATQQIRVVSQEWFSPGSYDFGYQWVTRITKDPATRHLIGDGIRIGQFVLSEDGRKFLSWLTE
jgi:hypothetical protein